MWISAKNPPEVKEIEFSDSSESVPVLGISIQGHIQVVVYVFDSYNQEERWFTNCSERWDVTGKITHWQPLPEPPVK